MEGWLMEDHVETMLEAGRTCFEKIKANKIRNSKLLIANLEH